MRSGSHEPTSSTGVDSPHPNLLTVISIAVVACAAADMVHEAVGHGIASWLVGDRILSISTVGIQNVTANRFVAACGTSANVIVGALSFLFLRRANRFASSVYFLWLFGAFNLFNSGYLIASALLSNGDWAAVIVGLTPPALWRIVLALAGVVLYTLAIRWTVDVMLAFVERGEVAPRDLRLLVLPAYAAGGVLMTAASVLNPISPSLILISGVGASFGLNCGFLFLPGMIDSRTRSRTLAGRPVPFSLFWFGLALVTALAFVAVLGPGIRIGQPH